MTQVLFATIKPRTLAAVRRRVPPRDVPAHFKAPLDMVWAFLGNHPGLRTDGHNVFLYHHPPGSGPTTPMDIDFGVEVSRGFRVQGLRHRCVCDLLTELGHVLLGDSADRLPAAVSELLVLPG